LDDVESESSKRQRQVLVDGVFWKAEQQTERIERIHVVVFGAYPDLLERQTLAIVHSAFLGIVTDNCFIVSICIKSQMKIENTHQN